MRKKKISFQDFKTHMKAEKKLQSGKLGDGYSIIRCCWVKKITNL